MPWRMSEPVLLVYAARRKALRDPLAAQDVRHEAAAKILPRARECQLHRDAVYLLESFFGLHSDAPTLPTADDLARVACLNRPNHHVAFCFRLVWALCDPGARQWVAPAFYSSTSTS